MCRTISGICISYKLKIASTFLEKSMAYCITHLLEIPWIEYSVELEMRSIETEEGVLWC